MSMSGKYYCKRCRVSFTRNDQWDVCPYCDKEDKVIYNACTMCGKKDALGLYEITEDGEEYRACDLCVYWYFKRLDREEENEK